MLKRIASTAALVAIFMAGAAEARPLVEKNNANGLCHGEDRFYSLSDHKSLTKRAFKDADLDDKHKTRHKVMKDCHRGGAETPEKMERQWDRGKNDWNAEFLYERRWAALSAADKAWARSTSSCESDYPSQHDSSGTFHGGFQFMLSTWQSAPLSPGGDPHYYPWTTQAVVAVALKNQDGAGHWPVCG